MEQWVVCGTFVHQVRVQFHVVSAGPPLLPSFSHQLFVGQKLTFCRSIKGTHQNDEPTVTTVRKEPRSHLWLFSFLRNHFLDKIIIGINE